MDIRCPICGSTDITRKPFDGWYCNSCFSSGEGYDYGPMTVLIVGKVKK